MLTETVTARCEDSTAGVTSGALMADVKVVILPVADRPDSVRPKPLIQHAELMIVDPGGYVSVNRVSEWLLASSRW